MNQCANKPRDVFSFAKIRGTGAALLAAALWSGAGTAANAQTPPTPTPPTPLPEKIPATDIVDVPPGTVQPTTLFLDNSNPPGQPQPGDPTIIRTLDEAIQIALQRSPTVLLAQERAIRTNFTVAQITALKKPQISARANYTRLSNGSASFSGGAAGGVSPSQVQNPFPVGLQITPPGAVPVTLSGGAGSGGGLRTGSAGATPPGGGGQASSGAAGASRAARQTGNTGGTGGNENPDGSGDGTSGGNTGGNNNGGFDFGGTSLNQYGLSASVSQLIDITGIVRTAIQIGDLEKALTRLELARARQETALNVKNGYYNVLRSSAFVRVNEAAVAQSEELLRVTTAQKNAGVAAEFDVLRARTQLENNRQALINSRNQVEIAKSAFANQLGIDPATPVDLAAPATPTVPELEEAALLARAFEQRPEYLQADVNILKAQKNTRLAHRGLEPYVNAGINVNYNPNPSVFSSEKGTATATLALNVPLSDGGATRAAVNGAKSEERQARIQKDQFARGIKAEVLQSVIAVRDARERTDSAQGTVEQAREALRLANVRYRAGVGTQLEINDAQTALTQAETNLVNAQYDYLGALSRLSRAVGDPI